MHKSKKLENSVSPSLRNSASSRSNKSKRTLLETYEEKYTLHKDKDLTYLQRFKGKVARESESIGNSNASSLKKINKSTKNGNQISENIKTSAIEQNKLENLSKNEQKSQKLLKKSKTNFVFKNDYNESQKETESKNMKKEDSLSKFASMCKNLEMEGRQGLNIKNPEIEFRYHYPQRSFGKSLFVKMLNDFEGSNDNRSELLKNIYQRSERSPSGKKLGYQKDMLRSAEEIGIQNNNISMRKVNRHRSVSEINFNWAT